MRDAECLAAETVQKFSVQCFARRESNGMHKAVKSIPVFAQIAEQLVDVVVAADIALKNQIAAKFLGHVRNTTAHTARPDR